MTAKFKLGAQAVNGRPRRYNSVKNTRLARYMTAIAAFGPFFKRFQRYVPRKLFMFRHVTPLDW